MLLLPRGMFSPPTSGGAGCLAALNESSAGILTISKSCETFSPMIGETYSVLIADDNEIDRFLLKRAINKSAARLKVVCEVSDGEDAVAYLSGLPPFSDRLLHPFPDLLILDTRMQRMDGLDVLSWLQQRDFYDLKVAMFADSSGTNLQAKALQAGATFFFSKIVHEPELIRMIRTLQEELERRARRMQVLLQHQSTQCFLRAGNGWSPLAHEGLEFESVDAAAAFAREQGLAHLVQIAMTFTANGQVFFFPINS